MSGRSKGKSKRCTHTTMRSVSATTLLWGLIDLDVLYDQIAGVEAFGIGVCFGVLEQCEEMLS